jgi:hypothetical protein
VVTAGHFKERKLFMRVVDEACHVQGGKLVVVLESASIEELNDGPSLKVAQQAAQKFGWGHALINGQTAALPCDENGNTPEDFAELAKLANRPNPRYRKTVTLCTPI